ncbi:MAG: hypothetical protein Q8S55_09640 [Methylococcaceae bacterium]|nr:hypothetical protein [Methylococcaceae bacterium]
MVIDVVLWTWFALTALAVAYVAYDQFKSEPEQKENSLAMKTMRWGWVLFTLYTGLFGFIIYWCRHGRRLGLGSPHLRSGNNPSNPQFTAWRAMGPAF